jgi:Rrf2 family transcriptional regulator, nitric oxide-sensitive transcriptional repressor
MISITAEYALRAVVVLAQANKPMKTKDVAEISQVPREYLAKIVQLLAKGKIIESKKGRGGGICLSKNLAEISLHDVIQVVDPLRHYEHCPFRLSEHKAGLCPLHRRLENLILNVEKEFKFTTLDQLILEKEGSALCEVSPKQGDQSATKRGREPLSAHHF